jgi:hypothetical protein
VADVAHDVAVPHRDSSRRIGILFTRVTSSAWKSLAYVEPFATWSSSLSRSRPAQSKIAGIAVGTDGKWMQHLARNLTDPVQYQNRIDEKRSKSERLLKGRMDLPSARKGVKGSP